MLRPGTVLRQDRQRVPERARELAASLELTSTDQTLLATAISEVARNITTYAKRGEVLLSIVREPPVMSDINGRGHIAVATPPVAELQRFVESEIVRWAKVVDAAGAKGTQ